MEVIIRNTAEEGSILAAKIMARRVREDPACVLGLATGSTPARMYGEMVRMHREEGLDFSRTTTFNLDEYLGLSPDHPQSYRYFMRRNLFDHLNLDPERTFLPDGMTPDSRKACRDYEARIRESGGIDLQVLGIGVNGHIGFNEPTGSLGGRTWMKILSEETIRENSVHFEKEEEVPRYCISMGIGTIMEAKHCLLLAFGQKKANAIADMVEGPITQMCPGSILQLHPRVTIIVDREAATFLHFKDHYRWVDAHKLDWQRYD